MAEISNVGKYEIRREIGRGAMGVVYEAYDPLIKRLVALKTIRSDQLTGDDSANVVVRFRREAQAAGRLSHPNIVSIYDFGEDAGVWFIAMEYVRGRELKEYFEANERFSTANVTRIMTQILAALDYSHRQGVIHRDIKPANIFLLDDASTATASTAVSSVASPGASLSAASSGTVKVADFGIAHIESSNLTQVGAVLGTPSYMSPEQIQGLPIDGRSDLFSAGVILYQFLTGERPFAGSATTTMQKVLKEDPLPPSSLNVQSPAAMDAIVRKALAKRPEDRYQTAQDFADALRAGAQGMANSAAEATMVDASTRSQSINRGAADQTIANSAAATLVAPPQEAAGSVARATGGSARTEAPVAPGTSAPTAERKSQGATIAAIVAAVVAAIAAGGWFASQRSTTATTKAQDTQVAAAAGAAPAVAAAVSAPGPVASALPSVTDVGTKTDGVTISAVGLIDTSDPRYANDKALLQSDLRADSKRQLVAKALGLMLDPDSLEKNYDLLRDKLLSKSGSFITTVLSESEPRVGPDGLMSLTTKGVVDVKAVQKSLNQMSRDERVELIRATGDPKVSVAISVRDADLPDAAAQPSPVAENILKERIKSFGFRTWSADDPQRSATAAAAAPETGKQGADFAVIGEAKIKKLSARLEASGLTITKFALTSWTVKCVDRDTGEEIYYNTTLPKDLGSWSTEEDALKAIGARIADEFSRGFFLQHVNSTGQNIAVRFDGISPAAERLVAGELIGLPAVIAVGARADGSVYPIQLAGTGAPGDVVADAIVKPLNAKFGQICFSLGAIAADRVAIAFDPRCADPAMLSTVERNPPAGLYGAPPGRQKSVVKNAETLRRLTI